MVNRVRSFVGKIIFFRCCVLKLLSEPMICFYATFDINDVNRVFAANLCVRKHAFLIFPATPCV